jgi:hypothetical protein
MKKIHNSHLLSLTSTLASVASLAVVISPAMVYAQDDFIIADGAITPAVKASKGTASVLASPQPVLSPFKEDGDSKDAKKSVPVVTSSNEIDALALPQANKVVTTAQKVPVNKTVAQDAPVAAAPEKKESFFGSLFGSKKEESIAIQSTDLPPVQDGYLKPSRYAKRLPVNVPHEVITEQGVSVKRVRPQGNLGYVAQVPVAPAFSPAPVVAAMPLAPAVSAPALPKPAPKALTPFDMPESQLAGLPNDGVMPLPQPVAPMPAAANTPAQPFDTAQVAYAQAPEQSSSMLGGLFSKSDGIYGHDQETVVKENRGFFEDKNAPVYTVDPNASKYKFLNGLELSVSTGLRVDDFDWNIASELNSTIPENVLSELQWSVQRYQVETGLKYTLPYAGVRGLYLEGMLSSSKTFSGDNQDSDYNTNYRRDEFSRSNNDASKGDASGGRFAVGYTFNYHEHRDPTVGYFTWTPVIGYAKEKQGYTMQDGFQTIPAYGSFDGLQSSYDAEWKTTFFGLRLEAGNHKNHMNLDFDYYKGNYDGEANWNLRDGFMHPRSFTQTADATGWKVGLMYSHEVLDNLGLYGAISYTTMQGEDGIDTVYLTDGTTASTTLNEVNLVSQYYSVGLNYRW